MSMYDIRPNQVEYPGFNGVKGSERENKVDVKRARVGMGSEENKLSSLPAEKI